MAGGHRGEDVVAVTRCLPPPSSSLSHRGPPALTSANSSCGTIDLAVQLGSDSLNGPGSSLSGLTAST